MIKFYVAPPRTGKTLIVVQREIVHYLKKGWCIFHNIPGLDAVKLAYYCNLYPEDVEKQLKYMYASCISRFIRDRNLFWELEKIGVYNIEVKYASKLAPIFDRAVSEIIDEIVSLPKNHLVVIDEAQNFIPATGYKEPKNIKFFEYATVHGHYGHDLVLVTQHEDNVDVKTRRIANLLIYMYRRDILGFLFRNTVREKHYAGCATGNPELLNKYTTRYDKRVFALYKSYAAEGVVEQRKFRSIWFNGTLIFLAVVFVVALSRVPKFLRTWGVIGKKEARKELVSPQEYLGVYDDYYCGKYLYVLRPGGKIDVLSPAGVPVSVCPSKSYSPEREVPKP